MSKIVRTPVRAEGGITPDEKARMDVIAQKWIDVAMRTDPIEPDKIVPAIRALYAAAGLKQPRVVIVPSPLVMAFAYGAASWTWHCRKQNAATRAATDDATRAATRAATYDATVDATVAATVDPQKAAAAACLDIAGMGGLLCAQRWWNSYQGGNMWAAFPAYLAAARDVLGLRLPEHKKYQSWEDCALHGGFRVTHEEFCIVSDFPMQIHKDAQNRPHNDRGPSHEWRDGWKLYHIHGVRIDGWIIEQPERITVQAIDAERNAEVRRIMIEKYGTARYLLDSGARQLQRDDYGVLYRKEIPGDEPIVMVRVLNSTPEPDGHLTSAQAAEAFGEHAVRTRLETMKQIGVPVSGTPRFKDYFLRVPPTMRSAHEAIAWSFGRTAKNYAPSIET